MIELDPCVVCRRHVAITESACPFCGAELPERAAQVFAKHRLSRAAVFVAGVALAACGGSKKDPAVQLHPATSDAGVADAADAALQPPHEKTEYRHPGGGGCTYPGNGQPPVCMPYGAPPARRRVV